MGRRRVDTWRYDIKQARCYSNRLLNRICETEECKTASNCKACELSDVCCETMAYLRELNKFERKARYRDNLAW